METYTKESNKQSESKDDIEETPSYLSTIPESLTDDQHPEGQSATIAKEATDSGEYESRQEGRTGYSSSKTSNEDACQIETEYEESEVKEDGGERETSFSQDSLMPESQHLMNINESETDLNASGIDDRNYNTCAPSSDPNSQSENSSSIEIVDIPTHQSSISTRNTISTSLSESSVPLAIPSTSRDSSELGAAESSPKRPSNFGTNEKQALHVFHPRNPNSIPIPIHRGHWVYLRDSPESSDYGGSPDSLDDPFLLEALNISTPENEIESMHPSEKENSPLGSQSSLSPIRDELLPSESSQIEMRSEDASSESCHVEGSIEDLLSESSHIQVSIEDLSSASSHNKGCIEDLSNDLGGIEMIIEDHLCQPIQFKESTTDLCVFGHSEIGTVDLTPESCHIEENTGHLSAESGHSCENIRDQPRELGDIEVSIEDQRSESAHIEESIRDLSAESGHNDGRIVVQSYESGHIEVSIEDKPSESSRNEVIIEDQPHASDHI